MMRVGLLILLASAVVAGAALAQDAKAPKRAMCPVDYKQMVVTPQSVSILVNGAPKYLCSTQCRDKMVVWPEKYLKGEVVQCTVQPEFKGHIDMPRRVEVNNGLYFLCCAPCTDWLRDKPWLYVKELRDPVSGKSFAVMETSPKSMVKGQVFLFESAENKATFDKDNAKYLVPFRK
jgi:YHS domain-containing protein